MNAHQIILQHTRIASPHLCPEIRLRLITSECPLWRADETELERIGMDEPFWGFAWAGGQALARYLLDRPELVRGKRVLDIGCGGGVEAVAAALAGAASVEAWDTDPLAIECLALNAQLNEVQVIGKKGDPLTLTRPDQAQLILAGDMSYDASITRRLMSWLRGSSVPVPALLADPERGFLTEADGLQVLQVCKAPSDVDAGGKYMRDTRILGLRWAGLEPERKHARMPS